MTFMKGMRLMLPGLILLLGLSMVVKTADLVLGLLGLPVPI